MAQFASDSFTGVDGTTLQVHSANWVEHPSSAGGDMLITANRLQQRVTGEGFYYHSASPSSADYSVSADFYVVSYSPAFNASGVIGRTSTTANTFYHARHRISGGWELYKRVTGTFTLLGSQTISTPAVGGTYNLKLDMVGSTIRLLADGVELVSAADTSITATGKAGLRISNASAQTTAEGFHFDNFSADDAAAPSPDVTLPLSGQSIVSASGSLSPSTAVALSGQQSGFSTGTLTPGVGVVVALSGQSLASTQGSLSPSTDIALSGQSLALSQGTTGLSGDVTVALAGIAIAASQGSLALPAAQSTGGHFAGVGVIGKKRKKRELVDSDREEIKHLLRMQLDEAYAALFQPEIPVEVQEQAAAIIQQFQRPEIDFEALQQEAFQVKQMLHMWEQQARQKQINEDEELLMMVI